MQINLIWDDTSAKCTNELVIICLIGFWHGFSCIPWHRPWHRPWHPMAPPPSSADLGGRARTFGLALGTTRSSRGSAASACAGASSSEPAMEVGSSSTSDLRHGRPWEAPLLSLDPVPSRCSLPELHWFLGCHEFSPSYHQLAFTAVGYPGTSSCTICGPRQSHIDSQEIGGAVPFYVYHELTAYLCWARSHVSHN